MRNLRSTCHGGDSRAPKLDVTQFSNKVLADAAVQDVADNWSMPSFPSRTFSGAKA